jgi:hypothetical protein
MEGLCAKGARLGPAEKQAAIASLKELIAMMQGKMAEGDGEQEMSGDSLSEAIEEATEGAAQSESPKMEMSEDAMSMQEDMKNMLNGPKAKPSRAKMSAVAIQVKKPGKKFGKA